MDDSYSKRYFMQKKQQQQKKIIIIRFDDLVMLSRKMH